MKRPVRGDLAVPETQENPTISNSAPADQGEFGANETRTVSQSGTKLTQPGSATVLGADPAQMKRHMRVLRTKFGASSKIGRRASNVEEALMNLPGDSDFQRTNLEKSIKRQLEGIAELMSAGV